MFTVALGISSLWLAADRRIDFYRNVHPNVLWYKRPYGVYMFLLRYYTLRCCSNIFYWRFSSLYCNLLRDAIFYLVFGVLHASRVCECPISTLCRSSLYVHKSAGNVGYTSILIAIWCWYHRCCVSVPFFRFFLSYFEFIITMATKITKR